MRKGPFPLRKPPSPSRKVSHPARETLRAVKGPRVIVHVDLDAFYASAEVLDDPSLRGKPLVVGGHPTRGVVLTANYEARKFGIRSALPMSRAVKLCDHLVVVPPRFARYSELSRKFFEVLHRYSPLVEGLSVDEAFLDLTGTELLLGPPEEAVRRMRADILRETGLHASAGIAPVKFAAKIGSDVAKPNGQLFVDQAGLNAFLDPLPVGRLFGVGPKTEAALKSARVKTIGDLRRASPKQLEWALGGDLAGLQALARGEDDREVVPDREAKSVGAEETFDEDVDDLDTVETYLLEQAERVASRMRRTGVAAAGVTLKYKLHDFRLVTRQTTLPRATNDGPTLFAAVKKLLHAHRPPEPIRLCGVSAHSLGPPPAPELFARHDDRQDKVNAALDAVRAKFGDKAMTRARLLGLGDDD